VKFPPLTHFEHCFLAFHLLETLIIFVQLREAKKLTEKALTELLRTMKHAMMLFLPAVDVFKLYR
jgi:hypothetical protein